MDALQETTPSASITEISIEKITPNPDQPRTTFDKDSLDELATSIRELGIIQPLTLRKTDDDSYQIISGERRYRAAKMAGLETVPAYIREASDTELTEMALIENIQREDLNAIEIALTFKKLIDQYKLTQERLSERVGKKRTTIANFLRLLKLPAEIQLGLRDHKLEMRLLKKVYRFARLSNLPSNGKPRPRMATTVSSHHRESGAMTTSTSWPST